MGGVEAHDGSPLVNAAPQAFRRARGEWSPVGECAQAGASSLFEMPWGRVAGAGAGVGSGASAASSGASESDSGTVAGDSGDAGASPFLRNVSISCEYLDKPTRANVQRRTQHGRRRLRCRGESLATLARPLPEVDLQGKVGER